MIQTLSYRLRAEEWGVRTDADRQRMQIIRGAYRVAELTRESDPAFDHMSDSDMAEILDALRILECEDKLFPPRGLMNLAPEFMLEDGTLSYLETARNEFTARGWVEGAE